MTRAWATVRARVVHAMAAVVRAGVQARHDGVVRPAELLGGEAGHDGEVAAPFPDSLEALP